ncbi:hypothetical protein [Actinopolymorpha alba]|uniref:hypothetical protein n=1 Tax=Actinopolymorpha alba TaxID=533267 RepID=UPI000376105F|nr:hypothetical protein [Actinopolymorpha alba]
MNHRLRQLCVALILALIASGAFLLAPAPASACSCVSQSPAEAYDRADAVFVGRMTDRDVPSRLFSSTDRAVWTFDVSQVYKGEVHRQQEIVTVESGASCGLELQGSGPFVVYAEKNAGEPIPAPGEGQYAASLCGGSTELTPQVRTDLANRTPAEPILANAGGASGSSRWSWQLLGTAGLGFVAAGWALIHRWRTAG